MAGRSGTRPRCGAQRGCWLEVEGRGASDCKAPEPHVRPRPAPPRGAPRAAPDSQPLQARTSPAPFDVMWAAGQVRVAAKGRVGALPELSQRCAPCVVRPVLARRRCRSTSGSVQRVCLQRAGRAGGEGAGAGAAAGWAGGGERGALARPVSPSLCLCRNSSCQNGARRSAARSGGASSCL